MAVYVIECGEGGPVKIGRARDPLRRLAALQGANPVELRLLAVIEPSSAFRAPAEDADVEARLHRRFAADRIRGEWFARTPALEALVAEAAGKAPLPGSFAALRAGDDMLDRLAGEAEALRPSGAFCREFVFDRQFAPRLERMVGWASRRGPFRSRAEFFVAADGIRALLPACFGCSHHVRVTA